MEDPGREEQGENTGLDGPGKGMRVTVIGIVASTSLAAIKILAGIFGHSHALIADGVESMMDVLGSFVVWGSLKIATLPPDERHPWGHGKAEPLGGLAISVALLFAAAGIAFQSVREILTPHQAPAPYTLVVLVAVVVTKEILFRVLTRTGKAIRSSALEIEAWHHRSDALTSAAAFVGISVAVIAGKGYEAADDWAALFACGIIALNGVRLFRAALDEVLDRPADPETEERIRAIAGAVDGVQLIEKCRARKSGLVLYVEIHVEVDGSLSVSRGHEIAHDVKDVLLDTDLGIADVAVHIEPAETPPVT